MAAEGIQKTFVTELTEVTTTQKEANLGTIRWAGNKAYKYVKLQNSTATVAGAANDPVGYGAATGYGNHLVVLDMNDADGKPICAGFLQAAVTGTAGTAYYVWIQIKGGLTTTTTITGTPADGDLLKLTTTDKTLGVGAAADDPVNVYGNDVSAKIVIADCPF